MSDSAVERIRVLKAQLDCGAITPPERSELAGLLRSQPELGGELAEDIIIDRLLRQAARGIDDELFVRGLAARIDAERKPTEFIRRVANDRRLRPRRAQTLSRPWPRRVALAACLVLAVSLGWMVWPVPAAVDASLAVVEVIGSATVDHQHLVPGMRLQAGAVVRAEIDARLRLAAADGSIIELSEGAQLRLDELAMGLGLYCGQGRLDAQVRPRPPGSPLEIETPHGLATVIGTRFSLVVRSSTRLQVESGTVELVDAGDGLRHRVDAGGEAEAFGGEPIAERSDVVVCYDFSAGGGRQVHDRSRRAPPLDLTIDHPERVEWLTGGGLRLQQPVAIASAKPAGKIAHACGISGEISILAVVTADPRNLDGAGESYPKRIVGLSGGTASRNFTLGQGLHEGTRDVIDLRLRTSSGDHNGKPSITSVQPVVAARRQHLVFTRSADGRCRLYVDGNAVPTRQVDDELAEPQRYRSAAAAEQVLSGDFSNWDPAMRLFIGAERDRENEPTRDWLGVLHGVAIFDRALSAEEVGVLARRGW